MVISPILVMQNITDMKIQICDSISAFGGINFVFKYLEETKVIDLFKESPRFCHTKSLYLKRYNLLTIKLIYRWR